MEEGNKVISRRGFFALFGGFAAAEVARKIYVLPPMGGWNVSPGEALFYLRPGCFGILRRKGACVR